jgi:hypothetical protein
MGSSIQNSEGLDSSNKVSLKRLLMPDLDGMEEYPAQVSQENMLLVGWFWTNFLRPRCAD